MKILVYGAGNIGSLYAAKLNDAGHDVAILARGGRLHEIRECGIVLREFLSGHVSTTHVEAVEQLAPNDAYDLVLVILPSQRVSEVLPVLATNRNTPNVLFFGNNASGPDAMIEAIGRQRVLLGFPGAAAVRNEDIRYLVLNSREQPTTIGEVGGADSKRIQAIANAFRQADFPVSVCSNMDAWLKTHVAEISPTANALYRAGGDIGQLQHDRETLVMMIRAIREGYRVLSALGVPMTPSNHEIMRWIPEWTLVAIAKRKLGDKATCIKIGHVEAARDEMKTIADEFRELACRSGVDTPVIDQLRTYVDNTEQGDDECVGRSRTTRPHARVTDTAR